MPASCVATDLNYGTYFLTLTIQRWYYLFDRRKRWDILADSLRYCIDHKGLALNGYVFMRNHLHLIVTSPDMAGFLRDFKKLTSKKFKENLETHESSVLSLFVDIPILDGWQRTEKNRESRFLFAKTKLHPRKSVEKGLCGSSRVLVLVVRQSCFAVACSIFQCITRTDIFV